MPFLIDGHNLIPAAGLRLDDEQDEARLIALLRRFCAQTGKHVTVYFDRRGPGSSQPPTAGGLTIRFCTPPSTADDAIRRHLTRLRAQAGNWTVVSSDRQVQAQAKLAGARVIGGPAFVAQMRAGGVRPASEEKPESPLSAEQAAELEREFHRRDRRRPGS